MADDTWTWHCVDGPPPPGEDGYQRWYAPPPDPPGLRWLRPGRILLQDLGLSRVTLDDIRKIGTLQCAVKILMRILSQSDDALLVPFVDGLIGDVGDGQGAKALAALAGQHFRENPPPVVYDGLPMLGARDAQANDPPDFAARAAEDGTIDRIVAVIDVDIGFANARFRRAPDRTRFAWFWDMGATARSAPPFAPGRFLYGEEIDEYLALLAQPLGNEWDLYRTYVRDSYLDPASVLLPSPYAHGSHVLDIAQGGPGVGDGTALFGIELPRPAVALNDGQTVGELLNLALFYAAAHRLMIWAAQGAMPELQVNISVGGHSGRHDGASPGEQFMEAMLADQPLGFRLIDAIYLPAGNSRDTRTHRRFCSSEITGAPAPAVWRIRPDDGTPNFLEIWLPESKKPASDTGPIRLEITPPSGLPPRVFDFDALPPGTVVELVNSAGDVVCMLTVEDVQGYIRLKPIGPVRRRILIAVTHTRSNIGEILVGMGAGRIEAAGDWGLAIQVRNQPTESQVGLWIGRDAEILRYRSGARQSIFADVELAPGMPQPVREDGTISDLACGVSTCVLGAIFASDGEVTEYSSEGIIAGCPPFDRNFLPTAAAVAEESTAHRGILAAGYFSGGTWRQGGTSVSAPLALRYILERQAPRGLDSVKKVLETTAKHDEVGRPKGPKDVPPDGLIGFGRLDASTELLGYRPRRRR